MAKLSCFSHDIVLNQIINNSSLAPVFCNVQNTEQTVDKEEEER
jgi:hypothetical protein